MSDIIVAAIQMDAQVGMIEANLTHATSLVNDAAAQGAQLIVLPELFNTGYEYTDRNYELCEPLSGRTGRWIVETAQRLGVHLVGTFPARTAEGTHIVAMLAAPDGRQWIYRKIHVAFWENCFYDRGSEPVIADTDLGRIGLLICWDQVFSDLARAYQGNVDMLCIPSSPPIWLGTFEDAQGQNLARAETLSSFGSTIDGIAWFDQAQVQHARSAAAPVVYAARCGTFHSPIPYGFSFLLGIGARKAIRVLRAVGTRYWLRCPMMGRSCILNAKGERIIVAGQDKEAVLVSAVQITAPDTAALPAVAKSRSLVPGLPRSQLQFDDSMIRLGRRYRQRHQP